MTVASWIYDHAPERVRDWMERREMDREATEQYDALVDRGLEPSADWSRTASQIMTRGFLEHEADRLGKLSGQMIEALGEGPTDIRLVEASDMVGERGWEANYAIGQSSAGFHYSINEIVHPERGASYEVDGKWSEPLASEEARSAGRTKLNEARNELVAEEYSHGPSREDRLSDLQQQQQQARDYVKEMVERLQEVEREKPEQKQERSQEKRSERER